MCMYITNKVTKETGIDRNIFKDSPNEIRTKVKLLFFAKSCELVGERSSQIDLLSQCTADQLYKQVVQKFPRLDPISENFLLALNQEYLERDNSEVTIHSAYSLSLMDHIELLHTTLSVENATQLVTSATSGAIAIFIGTTRNHFEGKKVLRLEYEAYESMAVKEIKAICTEMRQKWPCIDKTCILHRLGLVPVTEASVVIAVSSAHRKEALEATHWAIDTLKAKVPIWKKEIYEDGESTWKENKECKWKTNG